LEAKPRRTAAEEPKRKAVMLPKVEDMKPHVRYTIRAICKAITHDPVIGGNVRSEAKRVS